jgi:hypothetical protein
VAPLPHPESRESGGGERRRGRREDRGRGRRLPVLVLEHGRGGQRGAYVALLGLAALVALVGRPPPLLVGLAGRQKVVGVLPLLPLRVLRLLQVLPRSPPVVRGVGGMVVRGAPRRAPPRRARGRGRGRGRRRRRACPARSLPMATMRRTGRGRRRRRRGRGQAPTAAAWIGWGRGEEAGREVSPGPLSLPSFRWSNC